MHPHELPTFPESSRYLADHIPGARYLMVEGVMDNWLYTASSSRTTATSENGWRGLVMEMIGNRLLICTVPSTPDSD